MKALTELADHDYYGYDHLLDSFEVEVLLKVDDGSYQGDTWTLLRDGERFGLLTFGWGSCSGCDALEACTGLAEVTELRDQLWTQVHWEPDAAALLAYINGKDWTLDYSHSPEFLDKARELLAAAGAR